MTFETGTGFVPTVSRLDALATRLANEVIAGTYSCAREAAKANRVEYAAHDTKIKERRQTQTGNFARKIVDTLAKMGYDKDGNQL